MDRPPSTATRPCDDRPMDNLNLRLADDGDLAAVVRLRDDAARWMLARGVTGPSGG